MPPLTIQALIGVGALLMRAGLTAGYTVAPSMASFEGGRALARHIAQYYELRVCGSPEPNVCDVYVHAVGSDKFWWVGKSCAREGAGGVDGPALAVILQKQLVLEHAKILQPLELGQADELEVWCAPLNGEFTSAQRAEDGIHSLTSLRPNASDGTSAEEGSGDATAVAVLAMSDVGFLPHAADEDGSTGDNLLCVQLRDDGQFPLNCPWLCLVARGS